MTDLLVLHASRCMGYTELDRIADAAGLSVPETESRLIDLAVAGLVTKVPGPFGGWGVTEAGKAADVHLIAEELAAAGSRPVVADAYASFLRLNPELLDLCSAWHMRTIGGVPEVNDHSDAAYDHRVSRGPWANHRWCPRPPSGSIPPPDASTPLSESSTKAP